jgi:hypothetical protein
MVRTVRLDEELIDLTAGLSKLPHERGLVLDGHDAILRIGHDKYLHGWELRRRGGRRKRQARHRSVTNGAAAVDASATMTASPTCPPGSALHSNQEGSPMQGRWMH